MQCLQAWERTSVWKRMAANDAVDAQWKPLVKSLECTKKFGLLPKDNGIPGAAPGTAASVSPGILLEMQILQPQPRPTKSETQGLGPRDLFEQTLQVTPTHPEFENFSHRDVSKYWNDMIRSLHAGGNMKNGEETEGMEAEEEWKYWFARKFCILSIF